MTISIHLDASLLRRLKRTASHRHLSVSRYIRDVLERNTEPDVPVKPLRELSRFPRIRLGGHAVRDTERL